MNKKNLTVFVCQVQCFFFAFDCFIQLNIFLLFSMSGKLYLNNHQYNKKVESDKFMLKKKQTTSCTSPEMKVKQVAS